MALAADGRTLYVADTGNQAVRAVSLPNGRVTTLAGTGAPTHERIADIQPVTETALSAPWELALDGETPWVAMAGTHQLWALDRAAGTIRPAAGTGVESIHDGPLAEATFAQPCGITALDGVLYTADSETSAVHRVGPAADRVRRLVGRGLFDFADADGVGDQVRLPHPLGVSAVVEDGAAVSIADAYNHRLRRLDPATRTIVTITDGGQPGDADGPASEAAFREPGGLSVAGRRIYVADTNYHAVRVVDLDTQVVSTIEIRLPTGPSRFG